MEDSPSPSPSPSPTSFLSPNHPLSSPELEFSDDIEMTPLQSYTSLKDLLPDSPSPPPSATSPAFDQLPIKNPLVKHAALAYLQPMLTPPTTSHPTFLRILKKHGFGCIEWLAAVVHEVRRV